MALNLMQRIELACADARRRRHDVTEPEHLLGVVLQMDDVRDLLERGVDPIELRERLDVALTTREEIGGYRDGVDPPFSTSLQRVIGRLERRFGLGPAVTVLDVLLLEPSIAALVFELRRGDDHRHILERARAFAIVSGHVRITFAHVFRALLDLRSFVDTVERAGGAPDGLRSAVDEILSASRRDLEPTRAPKFDAVIRRALECGPDGAHAGAPPLSIRSACLALARLPEAERLWSASGIKASAFTHAVHVPHAPRRAGGLLR